MHNTNTTHELAGVLLALLALGQTPREVPDMIACLRSQKPHVSITENTAVWLLNQIAMCFTDEAERELRDFVGDHFEIVG